MTRLRNRRFVTIGHITNDTAPSDHLGGGVTYAAVAATRLGYESHIITKCPPDHQYITDLDRMGIRVHALPTKLNTITSFHNSYDQNGRRIQRVPEIQEPISLNDFAFFPPEILVDSITLIAPVVGEVDMQLFELLFRSSILAVTPQGYFREITASGLVTAKRWNGFDQYLKQAQVTVLSEEDIALDEGHGDNLLKEIVAACSTVLLTRGPNGVSIFERGTETAITAFPLMPNELIDFTGAGDTFAVAFITELARGIDVRTAAASAAFFAAVKIYGTGRGMGIDSVPTIDDLVEFRDLHPQRFSHFLENANTAKLSILNC